jgi:hypothetical protein
MSYNTGGKIPGKSGTLLPGSGASGCSIAGSGSAADGTSNGPSVGEMRGPGGKNGSTGTASDSKPSS